MGLEQKAQEILDFADIKINGKREEDIQIKDEAVYKRVFSGGTLALGEAYMDGLWDSSALDKSFYKMIKAGLDKRIKITGNFIWHFFKAVILNQQTKSRARVVGEKHYDIGNNLYKHMLDKRMNYSCAYWKNAKTLDEAQEAKLDLICKKLKLKSGMTVLDIGCGWGAFAKFAAEKYDVKVVGITISKEQEKLARELCKGLDVKILLQDYRELNIKFDRIVSVGMFEHVGRKNYREFMNAVDRCLKPDGLFLLHTIGGNKSASSSEPWIAKYIFPNSMLPSAKQITKASEGLFQLEDWHSFGTHYDKTIMAWHKNFNRNWDKIKEDYDERFYRMWNYYLLSCAASFRAQKNQLWQIVFSKSGGQKGYESVR